MEPDTDLGYFQGGMIPPDHPIQHFAQLDPSMLRHLGSHQLPVLYYISKYTLTRYIYVFLTVALQKLTLVPLLE